MRKERSTRRRRRRRKLTSAANDMSSIEEILAQCRRAGGLYTVYRGTLYIIQGDTLHNTGGHSTQYRDWPLLPQYTIHRTQDIRPNARHRTHDTKQITQYNTHHKTQIYCINSIGCQTVY